MRNYLYIPLGGNQVNSKARLYFNLGFVFLMSGLWHGAAWTFAFWGAYHGAFLIIERIFLLKYLKKLPSYISVLYSFPVVIVGWVFFRSESIDDAFTFVSKMFAFDFSKQEFFSNPDFKVLFWVAVAFSFCSLIKPVVKFQDTLFNGSLKPAGYVLWSVCSAAIFILSLSSITGSDYNPFIYFRF